ncbi:MAG: sialidase [Cyclobacteriaceae bacterium]|nr:MAG: sialidase [Cyclobacteriaceae bacterium]
MKFIILLISVVVTCSFGCTDSSNSRLELGVDSVNIYQSVTPVLIGKDHNPVLQIKVDIGNSDSPGVLSALTLSSVGTTNLDDIQAISVYRADSINKFNVDDLLATTSEIKTDMTLTGEWPLTKGANYFWVSCQLNPTANLLNKVKLACSSVSVEGNELIPANVTPDVPKRIAHALRLSGDDGVDTYRIPGLATTNNGTLIGVYDVRRNSSVDLQADIDIGMSRSTDGGQTWEPMKVILDMGEWGGKPDSENGIGDPSILVDRQTNTIWVAGIWAHGHPDERNWFASKPGLEPVETSQFILTKSEDDGITWSPPINITKQIKHPKWHLLLAGPGKGISLKDGTLVFPAQFKDENEVPYASIIYSMDGGTTWHMGTGVRKETTEAQVVQLKNGDIMINARNNEARGQKGVGRVVATTGDFGQTWTMHPSNIVALEEPTCMASLINEAFENYGDLLLFSNPNNHTDRSYLTIKASVDEGLSWPQDRWLLLDQGRGRGYSCMTRIDDRTIGILYEGSQADMVFEKVDISEVLK